jgi:beta-carotene/zeaxanthin 4-ketolase
MDKKTRTGWLPQQGIIFAVTIFLGWFFSLYTGLFLLSPPTDLPVSTILVVFVTTFFFTGLFITAHDGMHGTIAPGHKTINKLLGSTAVWLYALFSFRKLCECHYLHHKSPATALDPDYSEDHTDSFFYWYTSFLLRYISVVQFLGMAFVANLLIHIAGLPTINVLIFWAFPACLSTVQLFFFGTYLPHRPHGHPFPDHHKARSLLQGRLVSFFSCYHFGCHHQHHATPQVPWWSLWSTEQTFKP